MKGVTPIVAIIILLLITIALAGAAYTYLSTYFQGVTGKATQIIDAFCTAGTTTKIVIRNIGTQQLSLGNCAATPLTAGSGPSTCGDLTLTKSSGGAWGSASFDASSLGVGVTSTFTDTCGSATFCSYRFLAAGSALGPALATVQC